MYPSLYIMCDFLFNILYTPYNFQKALKAMKDNASNSGMNKWVN